LGAIVTWLVARFYYGKTLQAASRDKEQLLARSSELEGAIDKGQNEAHEAAQRKVDLEVIEKGASTRNQRRNSRSLPSCSSSSRGEIPGLPCPDSRTEEETPALNPALQQLPRTGAAPIRTLNASRLSKPAFRARSSDFAGKRRRLVP